VYAGNIGRRVAGCRCLRLKPEAQEAWKKCQNEVGGDRRILRQTIDPVLASTNPSMELACGQIGYV